MEELSVKGPPWTFTFLKGMDVRYDQATGAIALCDFEDGTAIIARGYSGKGRFRNEPSYEDRVAEGPIPRGLWRMDFASQHPRLGPVCIRLDPVGHTAHGRTGFFIHGDNATRSGNASSGCIILERSAREFLAALRKLGIADLYVT